MQKAMVDEQKMVKQSPKLQDPKDKPVVQSNEAGAIPEVVEQQPEKTPAIKVIPAPTEQVDDDK